MEFKHRIPNLFYCPPLFYKGDKVDNKNSGGKAVVDVKRIFERSYGNFMWVHHNFFIVSTTLVESKKS